MKRVTYLEIFTFFSGGYDMFMEIEARAAVQFNADAVRIARLLWLQFP